MAGMSASRIGGFSLPLGAVLGLVVMLIRWAGHVPPLQFRPPQGPRHRGWLGLHRRARIAGHRGSLP